ncbi:Uncharacterised protein [Klebsiella pneumoniae]|nr:Uncharacterised protein [Klebsiella pneumoniae]
MLAQGINSPTFGCCGDKQFCLSKTVFPQHLLYLAFNLINTRFVHAIGFGQRHCQHRVTGQLQNRQMLTGLCHHAVIARHHQQRVIDTTNASQHVGKKLFMTGNVGIAEIDGHAALFFFRQTVGIYASNRLQ